MFAFFEQNVDTVRGLLRRAIGEVPAERGLPVRRGPNGEVRPPPPAAG